MPDSQPTYLYMFGEDLYRLGNATTPKLQNVRVGDVQLQERNGIMWVIANGRGISLITQARLERDQQVNRGNYAWRLPANYPMPAGLVLKADTDRLKPGQVPDHYFLCPAKDMYLAEYIVLLTRLAANFERIRKL